VVGTVDGTPVIEHLRRSTRLCRFRCESLRTPAPSSDEPAGPVLADGWGRCSAPAIPASNKQRVVGTPALRGGRATAHSAEIGERTMREVDTMNAKNSTRTAERRQQEAEALHASIIEQVQQLADSGQWRAFLDFARSFHTYSLNNLLLILAQNSDATMVAGYRQWQAKGRQVRKGEKSIKIFGYRERKTDRTEDDATEGDERVIRYFPTLSVFDITQTDLIDGADALPENPTRRLAGDDDHGVIDPLSAHLESRGWSIHDALLSHANGYTDPESRQVILAKNLAAEQAAKTLIHEAAHIELRHIDDVDEYRAHRGRMEVEAESVAYIVAGLSGFDTSAYSIGYITGWADEDVDTIRTTAAQVLKTADAIAKVIDGTI
jgi:antirestriction protein ArdC